MRETEQMIQMNDEYDESDTAQYFWISSGF